MTIEEYVEDRCEDVRAETFDLLVSVLQENGMSEEDIAMTKEGYLRKVSQG